MFGLPPSSVEWLAVGAVLSALGALITFGGWTFLIAGYDESTPVPEDVAATMVGNTVLRLGVALLAVGAVGAVSGVPSFAGPLLAVVIVVAVGRLLYRLNTYDPEPS